VAAMRLKVKIEWDYGLPEYDPEKHDPDKVFALLCYRGVSYAKWVTLNVFGTPSWYLKNPRKGEK
tara:strand:- start:1220 stop:1414 length:195 start_codon:yes stop_codon:yes gene_type:complete